MTKVMFTLTLIVLPLLYCTVCCVYTIITNLGRAHDANHSYSQVSGVNRGQVVDMIARSHKPDTGWETC